VIFDIDEPIIEEDPISLSDSEEDSPAVAPRPTDGSSAVPFGSGDR
jgi:hypothetical protein